MIFCFCGIVVYWCIPKIILHAKENTFAYSDTYPHFEKHKYQERNQNWDPRLLISANNSLCDLG